MAFSHGGYHGGAYGRLDCQFNMDPLDVKTIGGCMDPLEHGYEFTVLVGNLLIKNR